MEASFKKANHTKNSEYLNSTLPNIQNQKYNCLKLTLQKRITSSSTVTIFDPRSLENENNGRIPGFLQMAKK